MARAERRGSPAAPGRAVGRLVRLHVAAPPPRRRAGPPEAESAALDAAIAAAIADLSALAGQAGGEAAEIVAFQVAMLEDPELAAPARAAIAAGTPAEAAWSAALAAQVAEYEGAGDAHFRARGADLRDLAARVRRHLGGAAPDAAAPPPGAILYAPDLTPSRFLEIDWRGGGGIALAAGSRASHVAMLARARGIPMVVGLGHVAAADGETALLDGSEGVLLLSPDAADHARHAQADGAVPAASVRGPAVTASGRRIALLLNIADIGELDAIDPECCDGIGLVRTELLFAAGLPDEATQEYAYRRLLAWAQGRPVTVRTLDAGGDKPVPGLSVAGEANPFLGQRGLRLSLAHPAVFAVQLRALLRAAAASSRIGPLKIMLPMVTVPAELEAARALLLAEAAALGLAPPPLGIMVEVPAAALCIADFAADFFSVGSNDLTQYVTAAARDIAAVAPLADAANPAVLRLIAEVAAHGVACGREVSVCGDAAGDPALVPRLLDAGITTLSMAPNALPAVRAAIAAHR
jgi:phosphotransferase system enzyme I (PtsI)